MSPLKQYTILSIIVLLHSMKEVKGIMEEFYDFARIAIDMALGQGDDQAVIKDGERIQYFGGKAQQVEKTTRVKARVKTYVLRELMETKDRLLITRRIYF